MEESITNVFFEDGCIGIVTTEGRHKTLPLEVFPALYYANKNQRMEFYLWDNNRSIRWEELDEDIHVSHFNEVENVNYDNEVNKLLSNYAGIDLKRFASSIGIHWTLLARLKFGVVTASTAMLERIKNGIQSIGHEMIRLA